MNERDANDANDGRNVYFVGLNLATKEKELHELCSKYGQVDQCQLITDPRTQASRGFAFVVMNKTQDAEVMIRALDGTLFHDRTITVRLSRRGGARPASPGEYLGQKKGGAPQFPYPYPRDTYYEPGYHDPSPYAPPRDPYYREPYFREPYSSRDTFYRDMYYRDLYYSREREREREREVYPPRDVYYGRDPYHPGSYPPRDVYRDPYHIREAYPQYPLHTAHPETTYLSTPTVAITVSPTPQSHPVSVLPTTMNEMCADKAPNPSCSPKLPDGFTAPQDGALPIQAGGYENPTPHLGYHEFTPYPFR